MGLSATQRGTSRRRIISALLLGMVLLALGAASASANDGCSIEVEPRVAPGGSTFRFSAAGFMPTQVQLKHDRANPMAHPIEAVSEAWPFEVRSRGGDVGVWTATFSDESCEATARFRVTLANTDALVDAEEPQGGSVGIWLFGIVVGLVGGLVIGRRVRSANPA